MPEVHSVFIQIEAPKGDFEGRVAEGCYIVEGDLVTLTNRYGNPVRDAEGKIISQKLLPGEHHKPVAGLLTKKFRNARRGPNAPPRGFSGPINYPKSWDSVA